MLSDEERLARARALDIPDALLPTLMQQTEALVEAEVFHWPNVIPSVAAARRLLAIAESTSPWLLVGFAIDRADLFDWS